MSQAKSGGEVDAEWKEDIIDELESKNAEQLEELENAPVLASTVYDS